MLDSSLLEELHAETLPASLSKKQRKFIERYGSVPPEDLTDNILNSWLQPIPAPLNKATNKFGAIILLVLAAVIAGALLGTPEASALYYVVTQWNHTIKNFWDGQLPDGIRHAFRDDGIGLIGGLWGVFLVRNRFKPLKPLTKLDKFEINFHIWKLRLPISNVKDDKPFSGWQLACAFPLVLLYGLFGFGVGNLTIYIVQNVGFVQHGLEHLFSWLLPLLKEHTGTHGDAMIDRFQASMVDKWPGKLTGLLMAFFFGKRPAKGTMDDIQLWLCQQRYARNLHANNGDARPPWYYFPNWIATYNQVRSVGTTSLAVRSKAANITLRIVVIGLIAAATIYGWYILLFIVNT